jgi:hypothetical protein
MVRKTWGSFVMRSHAKVKDFGGSLQRKAIVGVMASASFMLSPLASAEKPWPVVMEADLGEYASTTTYRLNGSTVVHDTSRHAVLFQITTNGPPTVNGWTVTDFGYHIGVLSGGELGPLASQPNGPSYWPAVPTGETTTAPGLGYAVGAYTTVTIGLGSSEALSGGTVYVVTGLVIHAERTLPGQPTEYKTFTDYHIADFDLAKLVAENIAIGSRRFYGRPNDDGLPGDPNAFLRDVSYSGWAYKGGLFVGNMPWESRDQSGTARTQLHVASGGTGTLRRATLVLYDLGSPHQLSGSIIGVFLPGVNDPNLNVATANVTWSNRWHIEPTDEPTDPIDYRYNPLSTVTVSGEGERYINFPLRDSEGAIPAMSLSRICLARTDEDTWSWRYFASTAFEALETTYPRMDSRPRVWRLGEIGISHVFSIEE